MTRLQRLGINRWSLLAVAGVGVVLAYVLIPTLAPRMNRAMDEIPYIHVPFVLLMVLCGVFVSALSIIYNHHVARGTAPFRVRAALFVSLSGIVIFVLLPMQFIMQGHQPRGMYFDSGAWQSPESVVWSHGTNTKRVKMSGDLIYFILPGKERAQVLDLLGDPDFGDSSHEQFWYHLGPSRLSAHHAEVLILHFDEKDMFERWEISALP